MCSAECKELLKTGVERIINIFKASLQPESEKIIACFYNCFKPEFIKRSSIIYNRYPEDIIAFVSNSSFTDSVLLFTQKAAAGEIYDGNASLKTILLSFYSNKLRQNLQTEKRLLEKKEKHYSGFSEATTAMVNDDHADSEKRYQLVEQALAKMEPADRQIITWRHLHQKSCDEIAALLGINKESATNRIYRCMQRLRSLTENSN
jgi:RNA polymerase sigma factor (sigma-70 family)